MKKNNSNIHATVMRRVRTIHTLRALTGGVAASFVVLALSLYFIGREVWVAHVVENMPRVTDVYAVGRFFTSAFVSTDMAVQALSLLSIIAFLWMVREAASLISVRPMRFT